MNPMPAPNAPPQGPPPGISGLVAPSQAPTGPAPDQKIQAYMEQIRNIHIQIDALAQDHPEAASDLNAAKTALTDSMSKVASVMSSPEAGPQPQTF